MQVCSPLYYASAPTRQSLFGVQIKFFIKGMFSSTAYGKLFRELVESNKDPGPFHTDWCNLPLAKFHVIQNTQINSTEVPAKCWSKAMAKR